MTDQEQDPKNPHKGYTYRFMMGRLHMYECERCGSLVLVDYKTYVSVEKHNNFHSLFTSIVAEVSP